MVTQSDGFALDFEIPAIFDRLLSQLAIRSDVAGAIVVAAVRNLLARGAQLLEQVLETTTDTRQCCGALFLQVLEEALVLGPYLVLTHAPIMPDYADSGPRRFDPVVCRSSRAKALPNTEANVPVSDRIRSTER
jgi:hypothetical protein